MKSFRIFFHGQLYHNTSCKISKHSEQKKIFHGQVADHGKNESNKGDFNEALEHNLEGKTSEKDRVSPEKKTHCWLC